MIHNSNTPDEIEQIRYCSFKINDYLEKKLLLGVSTTNTNEIQKLFSESFTEDTINKSLTQLKHEGVIFEPRKNEWRKI